MSGPLAAAACGVVLALTLAPWLARLTLSVPDRAARHWWRGRSASTRRTVVTAALSIGLALLAAQAAGAHADLPAFLALALIGAPLAIIDVEHHRLPDRLVAPAYLAATLGLGAAALTDGQGARAVRALEACVAVAAVFLAVALAAPGAVGLGDVKLVGLLGAYLGWLGWAAVLGGLFAGFVLGAVVSLVLIAARRATLTSAVAFGPALIVGSLLVAALG